MSKQFEFTDTLSYQSPEAPDCLMVPEAQWNKIHENLKQTKPFRDNLLWVLCGVFGGGAISCFITLPTISDTAPDYYFPVYLVVAIVLVFLAIGSGVVATKLSSETTSQEVAGQMDVLRPGFRKLTTKGVGKDEPISASTHNRPPEEKEV